MAGGRGTAVFTPAALRRIYRYSRGTPRLINILCDRALLVAYTQNVREISARTIALAYRDVTLKPAATPLLRRLAAAALILVLVAVCVYAYRSVTSAPLPVSAPAAAAAKQPSPSAQAPAGVPPAGPDFARAVRNELALRSEAKNALQAFNAVGALWKSPPVRRLDERKPLARELKRCADNRHLEMTTFAGNLDELLRFDTPALLALSAGESRGTFFVALTGVREGQLLIEPPLVGRNAFSRNEIAAVWSGRAHILWRNGKSIRFPLTMGARGESVEKVQHLLQAAGFRALAANGRYDEATRNSVRDFQKSRAIKETGTVDPLTLLQLYRSGNDPAAPGLTGSGKGGRA
jgi:general secretion pathway protein A